MIAGSKIQVEVTKFPGTYARFNGKSDLLITRRDYLRASLTVGFQSGLLARSVHRVIRKDRFLNGIRAHQWLEDKNGALCLNSNFRALNLSDKNPLTYWHGSIVAKIVAARKLDIPWLANVDEMKKQGLVQISKKSRERGDYVGLDSTGNWHASEAKGRSNPIPKDIVKKAKNQVGRKSTISNTES